LQLTEAKKKKKKEKQQKAATAAGDGDGVGPDDVGVLAREGVESGMRSSNSNNSSVSIDNRPDMVNMYAAARSQSAIC
jgi:hypothetical protein